MTLSEAIVKWAKVKKEFREHLDRIHCLIQDTCDRVSRECGQRLSPEYILRHVSLSMFGGESRDYLCWQKPIVMVVQYRVDAASFDTAIWQNVGENIPVTYAQIKKLIGVLEQVDTEKVEDWCQEALAANERLDDESPECPENATDQINWNRIPY